MLSHIRSLVTPWTVAHQASLSVGFPRQEYWSGLPFPPPGDLPDPGIEARSPALAIPEPRGKPQEQEYQFSIILPQRQETQITFFCMKDMISHIFCHNNIDLNL